MAFPKRVSLVPMNVAWFELNTGKQLPMCARYLVYLDAALVAITALATLGGPALVAVKREPLTPISIPLVSMQTGFATPPFSRYLDYIDNTINALTDYANAHGHPTPIARSQIPPPVSLTDPTTGLPTNNLSQYIANVDSIVQSLIAAGV